MPDEPPFPLGVSDRARRAFLAVIEADLASRPFMAGLTLEYRAIPPYRQPHDAPITTLVLTAPGTGCEARISAVTTTRQMVSTLSDRRAGTIPAMEEMRADARRMGILGVTKTITSYEPFPGDGIAEYEVAVREPFRVTSWMNPPQVEPQGGAPMTVVVKYNADPKEVVKLITAWAKMAARALHSPAPPEAIAVLRAVAKAKRSSPSGVDWKSVAGMRAEGQFAQALHTAGIALAFDPSDPDAGIDHPGAQPAAPPLSVTERMTRAMQSSGMGAIIDVNVMAAMVERMRGSLPTPTPPPPLAAPTFTPEAQVALLDDLAALDPEHLLWNLPRDEQGRLVQGARVLLASYDSVTPHGKGRRLWLVAAQPERRRDPQTPTLRLESLIGPNHTYRWDDARWLWDARATSARRDVRWGVDDLPLEKLGAGVWRAELAQPFDEESASERARAIRGILLQDAGRFEEALGLYGVEIAPAVTRILKGEPLGWHMRELSEPWAGAAREAIGATALWRLRPLLTTAAVQRKRWLAEKRGRKRPLPLLRLVRLPKQTGNSKAVLSLEARDADGGSPWVTLDWTQLDERLPAFAWRREIDLDLLRFGLLKPEELPYKV